MEPKLTQCRSLRGLVRIKSFSQLMRMGSFFRLVLIRMGALNGYIL